MEINHHVVYVPGLGDQQSHGQDVALKFWKIYGLNTHYHMMGWTDSEPFSIKLGRLVDNIDSLAQTGARVSLIGTSAGASVALDAYSVRRNKITSVVCICGKIQNAQTILESTFQENPSFRESMAMLPRSLGSLNDQDLSRILSVHPIKDYRVAIEDTVIEGANERTIPTVGHSLSIAYALTIGSISISRFINTTPPR